MAVAAIKKEHYTYADYITWDDDIRYELIEGVPYMMAAPNQAHQEICVALTGLFWSFLRGKPCRLLIAPFDVRLNAHSYDDTVVQPDLLIICDKSKLDGKSCLGAPDMVIEILSPSTGQRDKTKKMQLYKQAGVREYWTVSPEYKTVDVYILEGEKYHVNVYSENEVVPVHILEGCEINLVDVFIET